MNNVTIAVLVKDGMQSAMTFASLLAAVRDMEDYHRILVLYDEIPMQLDGVLKVLERYALVDRIWCSGMALVTKRNLAMRLCGTRNLIFIDDDMLVSVRALSTLMAKDRLEPDAPYIMVPALSPVNYFKWPDWIPPTEVRLSPVEGVRPYLYNMPEGRRQAIACGWTNAMCLDVRAFQSLGGFQLPRPDFPWMSDIYTTLLVSKKFGPGFVRYGSPAYQCERQIRYASPEEELIRQAINREIYAEAFELERKWNDRNKPTHYKMGTDE